MLIFRYLILLHLLFLSSLPCFSQENFFSAEEKKSTKANTPLSERILYGGSLGLRFGVETNIEVAPMAGFLINDWSAAGMGLSYFYFGSSYYNYSTSIYGGKLFGQLFPFEKGIAHAELEMLNVDAEFFYPSSVFPGSESRTWENNLLVGGGFKSYFNEKSYAAFLILFDVSQHPASPYTNPIFRLYIMF